ncbi:alpha/beta fold hydrolase [Gynuella sp.]|uniref:alpha/beta fold hydrolase n=1 Tax=Gynuella sp. TaxID=2969146 RepID=UPI003D10812B
MSKTIGTLRQLCRPFRFNIRTLAILVMMTIATVTCSSLDMRPTNSGSFENNLQVIDARPEQQFYWPYLLYIPDHVRSFQQPADILVLPNNTGSSSDDFSVHFAAAENQLRPVAQAVEDQNLPFILLTPVFPRFSDLHGGWKYYTHALDRDSILISQTDKTAITIHWQGNWLTQNHDNYISYSLDHLFVVQDNMIYRCEAADFKPQTHFEQVADLDMTLVFASGFNPDRPFNLMELPRDNGFIFSNLYKDSTGTIVNPEDDRHDGFRVTQISHLSDMKPGTEIPLLWNKDGEHFQNNTLKPIKRLDLQLIAMINNARQKLSNELSIVLPERVLMAGFSASGMFVDRFSYLHPEQVKAAVIGAPGGLPMSPVQQWDHQALRYPLGVSDYAEMTGRPFDQQAFAQVHRLVFLGARDNNDSVTYRDSFDVEDEEVVFKTFGRSMQQRFRVVEDIFAHEGISNTRFVLYPDVGHEMTDDIRREVVNFLLQWSEQPAPDRPQP